MAIIEVGSPPRLAGLPQIRRVGLHADRHRHCGRRHGRRRRVYQPRLPGTGASRRASRCCSCGWSAAASRCAGYSPTASSPPCFPAPAASTIFLTPDLSSGRRLPGGLAVGDGRLRGSGCTRRHGVRRVREGDPSGRSAARARALRRLDSVAGGAARHPPEQRIPDSLDRSEGRR